MDTWYLGLDIGPTSVGWAVCDEQYNIPRLRGQRAWGVRLFEEAQTAASRRLHRTMRRRYHRRRERLSYLREIFTHYITDIDPDFFERMQDSFLWQEDKHEQQPNSLFCDPDYTDADYFRDFPTIFHLRNYLMDPNGSTLSPKKLDARHYYLACHNIIKSRGHFLFEGEQEIDAANTKTKFSDLYLKLQSGLLDVAGFEFSAIFDSSTENDDEIIERSFEDILLEQLSIKGSLTDKKNVVKHVAVNCDVDEDEREDIKKLAVSIAQFLVGAKTDFGKILSLEEKVEVQLGKANTDEKIIEASEKLGMDWQPILEATKQLYDIGIARQIVGDATSLSASYIELFNRYKEELDIYNLGKDSKEKQVHELEESKHAELIKKYGGKKVAKPKLRGYYMGAIPMQLHLTELRKILRSFENDPRYEIFKTAQTEFKNDPSTVTDKEKVIKLLTHKVPYYVGPLQTIQIEGKQSKTDRQKPWCVRVPGQEKSKIYPWNFELIIDKTASAEKFIRRMTNKCTYLTDHHCLPKDSILYQKYLILNELNKLTIDGRGIDISTKQAIFTDIFMKRTDIKIGTLKEYLVSRGLQGDVSFADSAGLGGTIHHKMSSYLKFKEIFGGMTDKLIPKIEEAILSITILPDDKDILLKRLAEIFAEELSHEDIDNTALKRIAGFTFSKWGSLSAMLLDGIETTVKGENRTIIDALWSTNYNFMELLGSRFNYSEKINSYKEKHGYRSDDELINESYASVPVKRAARQAMKVVRELEGIIGRAPAKVFIETPRSREDTGRVDNRKSQLEKLYTNLKDDIAHYQRTKHELGDYEQVDLKPKAVYLYFLQNGRCAYCGEPLDISNLSATCDIDHIIPQSLLKDDSFDNLVLVHKEENRAKGDTYPLNLLKGLNFASMLSMWRSWHKNGLISNKKLRSLSRTELSNDEIAGFINRQIVETSQTTKMVMEILKLVMPKTEIVYQKAETVVEFKREWAQYEGSIIDGRFKPTYDEAGNKKLIKLIKPRFVKVRDLNDLHHAKDAYLNIVVGNVYSTRFTNNPVNWVREQLGDNPYAQRNWNMRTVMYDDRKHEVKQIADRNGVIVWDEDCLATVIKTYMRNDILVTFRPYRKTGAIYDQNILSFEQKKIRFPIKKGLDVTKYGGYTGSYTSYFKYIRDKGKKRFVGIPIRYISNPDEYLATEFPDCEILVDCIPIKSQLMVRGFPVTLDGSTGTNIAVTNTKSLLLNYDDTDYLARILKAKEKMVGDRHYILSETNDHITAERNRALYDLFVSLAKGAYALRPNIGSVLATIENAENRQKFCTLSLNNQVNMLVNILHLFQRLPRSSSSVNCELLGGDKQPGVTHFSIYEEDVQLIKYSATGLFKKVIDLSQL